MAYLHTDAVLIKGSVTFCMVSKTYLVKGTILLKETYIVQQVPREMIPTIKQTVGEKES